MLEVGPERVSTKPAEASQAALVPPLPQACRSACSAPSLILWGNPGILPIKSLFGLN